jgi:serine protease DegQ
MTGRKTTRAPLYSRSSRPGAHPAGAGPALSASASSPYSQPGSAARRATGASGASAAADATGADTPPARKPGRLQRMPPWAWGVAGAALVAVPLLVSQAMRPAQQILTQEHIDSAVLHTLQTQQLPSPATKAYAAVGPSLVRVVGLQKKPEKPAPATAPVKPGARPTMPEKKPPEAPDDREDGSSVGSGVVIIDTGIILTNLHVVAGADEVKVTFADGTESVASIVNVMPENDLAVLRAHNIPDDLQAATMRSTGDLRPGDRVTAVGFPFGIGPSVSSGVVSGLKREFRSPEGDQVLTNLIQFDAAANPGNSGGPLVTDDGEVVGIVTAILNPTQQRFFVGIGFAVPIENAAAGAGLPPF